MYTFQDLLEVGKDENKRIDFVYSVINDHKASELYQNAILAEEYYKRRNRTILTYQKILYTASGQGVPDNFSANYKMCSNFFNFFVTQENQYLLGNGVQWSDESTKKTLGKDFDTSLQILGKKALIEGIAFGFWNMDHLESFGVSEFAPLYDEENGALMAGVRFWQIDKTKPLRATFYEVDGLTEYIWKDGKGEVLRAKRHYINLTETTVMDGTVIYDGENYPSFPIVPLWGDDKKQSKIVGLQMDIDAYDLIKSGFANDIDDASQMYWILKNAGGMDDLDFNKFIQRIKTTHVLDLEDGVEAESHTQDVPYAAREAMLTRLRDDLFEQEMAYDPKKLASGGSVVTAAIKAAYQPLNNKTDGYEYCVDEFLSNLLKLIGIDDEKPTFTRDVLINQQEQIQVLTSASDYLPSDYLTKKILLLLGDGDLADDIVKQMQAEEMERLQYQHEQFGKTSNSEDEDDDKNNDDEPEE